MNHLNIRFENLEDIFENRGTVVIHETAVKCTCQRDDAYEAMVFEGKRRYRRTECGQCGGDNWIYRRPREVKGLITGITQNRQLVEAGWMIPGDCVFSPPPSLAPAIGDFDKITFKHAQPVTDGQVVVRGSATRHENASRQTGLKANEDRLYYIASRAIHCEDETGITYEEGQDFVFDGRKIVWNAHVPPGRAYTLKYEGFLEWLAFVPPMERRDGEASLGQRVLLRKLHVARLNGPPAKEIVEENVRILKGQFQC